MCTVYLSNLTNIQEPYLCLHGIRGLILNLSLPRFHPNPTLTQPLHVRRNHPRRLFTPVWLSCPPPLLLPPKRSQMQRNVHGSPPPLPIAGLRRQEEAHGGHQGCSWHCHRSAWTPSAKQPLLPRSKCSCTSRWLVIGKDICWFVILL